MLLGVPVEVLQSPLKLFGNSSAIFRSMESPVSATKVAPAISVVPAGLFQILRERAPSVYSEVKSVDDVAVVAVAQDTLDNCLDL